MLSGFDIGIAVNGIVMHNVDHVRYFVQCGILSDKVFCPVWYYNHWYFAIGIMTCGILYRGISTVGFRPRYFVRRYSDPLVL